MKVVLTRMGRMLKRNMLSLVIYEFIFRIGTWLAVIPLVTWLFELCMKVSGFRYITNQNIFLYLKNPLTIMLIILTTLCVLYLSVIEYAGLLVCYEYSMHNLSISPSEMLLEGIEMSRRSFNEWGIYLFVLLSLPINNFFMIALAVYKVQSLNYIAERLVIKKTSLLVILSIVIVLYVICSQVLLPLVSMYLSSEDKKMGIICQIKTYTKKYFFKNLHYFHQFNILSLLLLLIAAIIGATVMALLLAFMYEEKYLLVRIVHAGESLVILIGLLAGTVGTILNLAGMFTVYFLRMESNVGILEMKRRFINEKELLQPRKKKVTLTILSMIGIIEFFMVGYSIGFGAINVTDRLTGISVTAHRGASRVAPENTLASLSAAIDLFSDYAEIDVQESKDGVLFLLHDTDTARTCNESMIAYKETYETISTLDAGSKFSKDFAGEKIPTLEEALALCRGKINLNIEIKDNPDTPGVVEKTVRLIEEYGFIDCCVITSTNQEILKEVKRYNKDIRTGMILKIAIGDVYALDGVDFFSAKYTNVTENFVTKAHAAGMEVHVWTVNNGDIVRQMSGYHVDNIITDDPVKTQEILNEETYGAGFMTILRKIIAQLER